MSTMTKSWITWLAIVTVVVQVLPVLSAQEFQKRAVLGHKWEATNFCKCICFGTNYTILHLDYPDNPSSPCLSCTKQWCLNQNLPICAGAGIGDTNPDTATGKEGDVEARCFQRDSPRDQLVVTLFLLTVFGLLLAAGIKSKLLKAGFDTSRSWNPGPPGKWWEAWQQRSPRASNGISLGEGNWFSRMSGGRQRGEYVGVGTDVP